MADDDFELKKWLESLLALDHIAKHIIIVDLWLQQPQHWCDSDFVINARSYGKGRVYGLNHAVRRVENEAVLVMDCRCRVSEQELKGMLIESYYNDIVSPRIVNNRESRWIDPDFFLFRVEKSLFPIDKKIISYHYEKLLEHKGKILNFWEIKKIELEETDKATKARNDYRYKKDLSTIEQIIKEWQS